METATQHAFFGGVFWRFRIAASVSAISLTFLAGTAVAIDTTWDFNGDLTATSGLASMNFRETQTGRVRRVATPAVLRPVFSSGGHFGPLRVGTVEESSFKGMGER